MSIDRLQRNIMTDVNKITDSQHKLKNGQILSAKILKLYPDQKAEIQIGNDRLIAQLEAPLTVGNRYHLQVYMQNNTVYLKVLNEQQHVNQESNVQQLLNKLGLKDGKIETSFVQKLLKENIPFERSQLQQVLPLLNNMKNQAKAEQILLNMIKQQMPITKDVFLALYVRETSTLKDSLDLMKSAIEQALVENELNSATKYPQNNNNLKNENQIQMPNKLPISNQIRQQPLNLIEAVKQFQSKDINSNINELKNLETSLKKDILNKPQQSTEKGRNQLFETIKTLFNKTALQSNSDSKQSSNQLNASQNIESSKVIKSTNDLQVQKESPANETANLQQAKEIINSMTDASAHIKNAWLKELVPRVIENEQLFQHLQLKGLINKQDTFSNWQTKWQQFVDRVISQNISSTKQTSLELPFQLTKKNLLEAAQSQVKTAEIIRNNVSDVLNQFSKDLLRAVQTKTALSENKFEALKQEITQKILPNLSEMKQVEINKTLLNQPNSLRQIITMLAPMLENASITKALQTESLLKIDQLLNIPKAQTLFMENIKQATNTMGLNYERLLANDMLEQHQTSTLKNVLMKFAEGNNQQLSEQSKQMIHLINGMQINSIQESNHMLLASLQLPGLPLGLTNDINLEFEGSKSEDGKIDADFCRIVFYLELSNIEETVIDMNVQNRNIMMTIFNDHPEIKKTADNLHAILSEGLTSLSYTLSSVLVKPMSSKTTETETKRVISPYEKQTNHQGVDYRI